MKFSKYIAIAFFAAFALAGCKNESLQQYLVDKQDNDKFLKMDVAASLLQNNSSNFSEEEKEIWKTIKKVNVVAYPIKDGNISEYETEKGKLETILDQEQYKELTRIKSAEWNATLKYMGDEDAIDEVIVFASDNEKGFAVFRLLGENMRPDQMLKLMNSLENGKMDLSQLSGLGEMFKG
ncbi:DUF4252 domain-containing protein [Aequorivita echinoideorum]|uniref:DUF4252 domain-containing protein n=1 Tax=Aequorivita echinoideorum TaxID=1549647 RepID=A0ABS5S4K4_9FLAO|nr:DUF4252 domain-containing protein [Aequorivita echinoideorum]MBT0608128.1 DUF4252 domain-containing protein [Aequorivita echinoideorum]